MLQKALINDAHFSPLLLHTGQHKELVSDTLNCFNLKADIEINLPNNLESLNTKTAFLLNEIEKAFVENEPDIVIVQGDTLSAFCGAVTAHHHKIKLIHVEAGLRTGNKMAPFPEESYRKFIDSVSDVLLAPTDLAKKNLLAESYSEETIYVTGNTGIDALLFISKQIQINQLKPTLSILDFTNRTNNFALVTIHRREANEIYIREMLSSIISEARVHDLHILMIQHPRPEMKFLSEYTAHDDISVISSVNYIDMIYLIKNCKIIFSDSGGIQEEAPYLGKNVMVLRSESERQEAITEHGNILYNSENIKADIHNILTNNTKPPLPYGNGKSVNKIVTILKSL